MTNALIRYNEPLDIEELTFLTVKAEREKKLYYKVYNWLMIASFVLPFIGAWYRAFDGAPNAFSPARFFMGTGILLSISTAATYLAYKNNLRLVLCDIRHKTKTIEIVHILKKQYMRQNNAYYLYIDSPHKLTIEVASEFYHELTVGDEVSIEYTTNAKLYLGYF